MLCGDADAPCILFIFDQLIRDAFPSCLSPFNYESSADQKSKSLLKTETRNILDHTPRAAAAAGQISQ